MLQMGALQLGETAACDVSDGNQNRTAEIALVRSVITGWNQDGLCCDVRHPDADSTRPQAFLLSLFPIVCDLCDAGTEFQYLSFHLLSLWAQRLLACLPALSEKENARNLMGKDSVIIAKMLQRIWVSWDSPVEGVAESVAEAFKTLLEAWRAEVEAGRSDYAPLGGELAGKVVQMPWYARSRYKPLSLLIPYVDTDEVGH